MGEGLKKTGKVALWIITPTVVLIIVLVCLWAYKKYKKKKQVLDPVKPKEIEAEKSDKKEEAVVPKEVNSDDLSKDVSKVIDDSGKGEVDKESENESTI